MSNQDVTVADRSPEPTPAWAVAAMPPTATTAAVIRVEAGQREPSSVRASRARRTCGPAGNEPTGTPIPATANCGARSARLA
ncbi:hypothetical protein WY02_06230 [Pseudonocardia sp. AL041005-10]|nr:hypothetical protein WY02_06230 [Pseudonocardia sp. AL041005-10]